MQGDKILQTLAHALRDCTRETDVIGRMSGDEFVAILSNISNAVIENMINRLKH